MPARLPKARILLLFVLMALLSLRLLWASAPNPGPQDPAALISTKSQAAMLWLEGRVLVDGPLRDGACRALVQVHRINGQRRPGRTELQWRPCREGLRAGAWIRARGRLRAPAPAAHPLLSAPAQRLAAHGAWSQFRTKALEVTGQDWTPLADARRRIATQFQDAAGPDRGGLLAALVLGSAQVQLSAELRDGFRVAGLSHALAASGFHLSVLLGTTLALARSWPAALRLSSGAGAMGLFLALAGAQPSVVRAVLMGSVALLIREGGQRSRPLGVLVFSLVLMLLIHPAWLHSIGFQLSAAATAGLVITARPLELWLAARWPHRFGPWLSTALSVPLAALLWTLPLQLLHFGSTPLYALVANLLAAPLLAPLTLASMALALVVLVLPEGGTLLLLPWLIWPVKHLAALLIAMVTWISQWPFAQLLTGRPQPWVVLLLVLGLLPWLLQHWCGLRLRTLPLLLLAVLIQAMVQLADGLVVVEQWGRHWLLARHQGRAALVSSHGDRRSCALARRLVEAHGHRRLDWVALLDPVASDALHCWRALARTVLAEHQGQPPLAPGQRLASAGLELQAPEQMAGQGLLLLQAGRRRVNLRQATGRPLK